MTALLFAWHKRGNIKTTNTTTANNNKRKNKVNSCVIKKTNKKTLASAVICEIFSILKINISFANLAISSQVASNC